MRTVRGIPRTYFDQPLDESFLRFCRRLLQIPDVGQMAQEATSYLAQCP